MDGEEEDATENFNTSEVECHEEAGMDEGTRCEMLMDASTCWAGSKVSI